MSKFSDLWIESVLHSESIKDPVLLNVVEGAGSLRIFDQVGDDELVGAFGKIRALLNENKTRDKGAFVLKRFISSFDNQRRLISLQDQLGQGLRLLWTERGIQSPIVQGVLGHLLPKCKQLPDILKDLTPKGGGVSKIMGFCSEQIGKRENPEMFELMGVCLTNFRGTCGPFRTKLEKGLFPYLDKENEQVVKMVCNLLPLLTQTGGVGGTGDGYSKEWLGMVKKLGNEGYRTFKELMEGGGDMEENPFDGESNDDQELLVLEQIVENKVFMKMARLKRRLIHINFAITAFLRKSFPSPKPVPVKSLLKYISLLISTNPSELLAKQKGVGRKEVVLLAGLLPSVHGSAFELLESLISCIGTNLFPHGLVVEQLFTQQWRWMECKGSNYSDLRRTMYTTLDYWLTLTNGQVTDMVTLKHWVENLVREVELEKETVQLTTFTKSKKKHDSRIALLSSLGSNALSGSGSFLQKNPELCKLSISCVEKLLLSLDAKLHSAVYCSLVKTHVLTYQQGKFPGQYDDSTCRLKLTEALVQLALNPRSGSKISLGLVIRLLKRASLDPVSKIREFCHHGISTLERLIHPCRQASEFSDNLVDPNNVVSTVDRTVAILNSLRESEHDNDSNDAEIVFNTTACQTEDEISTVAVNSPLRVSTTDKEDEPAHSSGSDLKEIMIAINSLRQEVSKLSSPSPSVSTPSDRIHPITFPLPVNRATELQQSHTFNTKRKLLPNGDISSNTFMTEDTSSSFKKPKPSEPQDSIAVHSTIPHPIQDPNEDNSTPSLELLEMLNDFVDEEAPCI